MVVAAYSTDLTDMDLAASATGWAEATASGWTSVFAVTGGETDDYIQDTTCNSTTVKTGVGTLLYNNGAGITLGQDDAVLVWAKWDVYPSLDTEANGGIRTVMGNSLADFYGFKHLGSDSYIYDGWINLATGDPADADITADYTVGSPNTTKQYHGWAFNAISVPSKGNPYKVDAIRYGRCEIITINGDATAYGAFPDMAQENDYNDGTNGYNRWGLFRQVTADNYLWKGLMSLGNATVVDFRDSNATIKVDNTKHVTPAFNRIEINNASSRVDWTGVSIAALGTVSRGDLEVIDDADVNFEACSFTDMGTFGFLAASTINGTTFRRCNLITTGGGLFDSCSFDASNDTAKAVIASSPANAAKITASEFISAGTGNGLEIGGTAANITLTDLDFTGYSTTVDADKAIFVNIATGSMTINISGGSGVTADSHVRTAGCTVTVAADVSITFDKMKDDTEVRVFEHTSVVASDISFTSTDTIASAGSEFGVFAVGDEITVRGSLRNDGSYKILTASATTLTITALNIDTESAGAAITIKKTNQVEIDGIEDVTAGTVDNRSFTWASPAATVVDYVIHHWTGLAPFYQTIRVNGYVVPSANTTIDINQLVNRNAS